MPTRQRWMNKLQQPQGSPSPGPRDTNTMPPRSLRRHLRKVVVGVIVFFLVFRTLSNRLVDSICQSLPSSSSSPRCKPDPAPSDWNLLYHLGGNGPWIPKLNGLGHPEDPLPGKCVIDQVHMLSRHAERYPTKNAGRRHLALLNRLHRPNVNLQGPLAFLNSWTYFTDPADPLFENLTRHGPYAGTLQAQDTGRLFRRRYNHLVPNGQLTKFWSCDTPRDIETALNFAEGFFGPRWEDKQRARLEIISEDSSRGGDTLTPGDTCTRYRSDVLGHDFGYFMLNKWQKNFTAAIAERLERDAVNIHLSRFDIYGMMEMCGFELLARGYSPWCTVFTHEEWIQFEYARDLLHFYRAGPGNPYGPAMGWLYLNATADLLVKEHAKDVYFSFVHDGDLVPMLAALQILDEKTVVQELPTDRVKQGRQWVTSDVVPMGGRVVLERVACMEEGQKKRYVRVFVNDGLVRLAGLPASALIKHGVPVEDFWVFVVSRLGLFGEFRDVCGIADKVPDRITFLYQDR